MLRTGGLVALPTETVYGLGANAEDPVAVSRIFQAKGRPPSHPLIVHIAGAEQLDDWVQEVPEAARLLAERFWPGPLTLVLRRGSRVPLEATGGLETVAVRVPPVLNRQIMPSSCCRGRCWPCRIRWYLRSPGGLTWAVRLCGARMWAVWVA